MEIGWCIWTRKNRILLTFLVSLFFSCASENKLEHPSTTLTIEGLSNATIVCRLGTGFFSGFFRQYASAEKKYSHIGIIRMENGLPYVYHSEASEFTGVGFVKKEPLEVFLDGIAVYDFFEMAYAEEVKAKIIEQVDAYYLDKTPFDLAFDSFDNTELYCTELIATSINQVLEKQAIQPSLLWNGKEIYALDNIYLNENFTKIHLPLHTQGK